MFTECRHLMPSGLHCQSPAMRGSAFCYFHARAQRPARPATLREDRIEIPDKLDCQGIRRSIESIIQALASGRISSRRAAVLFFGLQMAPAALQSPAPGGLALNNPPLAPLDLTGIPSHVLDELNAVLDKLERPAAGNAKSPGGSRL